MAKIGLNNFRYSKLTEAPDGTPSYDGAKTPGKAISCNVSISNNSATLYADDTLAESDTSFQSGTVTMGIDEDDLETMAELLGHTYSDGVITRNANDTAPYVGLGRIVTKMVNGAYKYKVEFLYKVKFAEPSAENNTKGESVEFATTEIEGTVSALKNGKWSTAKTFTDKTEALTYLEGLMSNTSPVSTTYTVTYNANGGTGSIAPVTVNAGQSVTLSDGTGLTAPEGKTFGGWASTSSATTANINSPFTPTADITVYAVWTNTTYTVTYNANGGTGTITPETVTAGQSVTLSDGTGLTAPEGKQFSGWATTDSAETPNVTNPYTPTADITIYAVWEDE